MASSSTLMLVMVALLTLLMSVSNAYAQEYTAEELLSMSLEELTNLVVIMQPSTDVLADECQQG